MKAEHRKELQTNFLADRMGRLLQGVRSGPQSKSSAAVWVLTILTLGTLLLWYIAGARSNQSPLWVKFEEDTLRGDTDNLRLLAKENPGTLPARAARFQSARLLLEKGLAGLYSNDHEQKIRDVGKARELFQGLAKECIDDPVLASQALLGAGKAEEALVGIPNGGDPEQSLGEFDEALKYYRELTEKYPNTPAGVTAQERLNNLEKNRADAEKFYQDMRKQLVADSGKKP
jgi:tetratricopeptide (TPR) repeat protein